MPANSKHIIAGILAVACACLSIALFYLLCWTAAADAQGAIALFLYAPVLFALTFGVFFCGRYAAKGLRLGIIAKRFAIVLAAFYISFYLAPFVGLGFFTDKVIGSVAKFSKLTTGKTPMEWNQSPQ